jgi:signal peptidase I
LAITGSEMHLTDEFLKEIWCDSFIKNGKGWLRVITNSMEPLIKPGEMILIEKIQPQHVSFGDIIIFQVHDVFVAHRVIRKYLIDSRLFFLQKGDKGGHAMEIPEDWVIGRVIAIEKVNGLSIKLDGGLGRYVGYIFGIISYLRVSFSNKIPNSIKKILRIKIIKEIYYTFKNYVKGTATIMIDIIFVCKKSLISFRKR